MYTKCTHVITLFDEFHYNLQVTVGGRDGVPVGTLEYITAAVDSDPSAIIVVLCIACGLILVSIFFFLVVCWLHRWYEKNKMKAEARAIELQERIEREREMNLKRQEELEQQVENMASQVVVVHSQMKGTG